MSLEVGDYVIDIIHGAPSPIWEIQEIIPYDLNGAVAALRLRHSYDWAPAPLMNRLLPLSQLEQANGMLVIALLSQ